MSDAERIRDLERQVAKLIEARELAARASATLRDESIAKSERIRVLETALNSLLPGLMLDLRYADPRVLVACEFSGTVRDGLQAARDCASASKTDGQP